MIGSVLGGIGGAIGGIAVLAGAGGKGGLKEYKKAVEVWDKLKTSNFDFSTLQFPELLMVAEMMPEVYEAIVPPEVKQVADSPEMRAAQQRGLAHLESAAATGLPLGEKIAAQDAGRSLAREQRRGDQAILANLAARGQLSSGDELQARLMGNSSQAELARGLGSDLSRMAIANRMGAAQASAGLAGNIRGQDIALRQSNADAVNRFNELVARMKTQAAADAAGSRERSRLYNTSTKQELGTRSQLGRLATQEANINRKNSLLGAQFQQGAQRAAGLSAAYTGLGKARDMERAAKEQQIISLGQGLGQGIGGIADIVGGAGGFGGGIQGLYQRPQGGGYYWG